MQKQRIDQQQDQWNALHARIMERRKDADQLSVDLKDKEQLVSKYRVALNTTKTNKEYAAILTQINTLKADNAKVEEDALKILQEVDQVRQEADKVHSEIEDQQVKLQEIQKTSEAEIARLNAMLEGLDRDYAEAAKAVEPAALSTFSRLAKTYDGEAMAVVEVHGRRAPHTYVCGGCFMGLNAEHANALQVRDEIRTCDNCGRMLYMDSQPK